MMHKKKLEYILHQQGIQNNKHVADVLERTKLVRDSEIEKIMIQDDFINLKKANVKSAQNVIMKKYNISQFKFYKIINNVRF
jgi:hypothetical protein